MGQDDIGDEPKYLAVSEADSNPIGAGDELLAHRPLQRCGEALRAFRSEVVSQVASLPRPIDATATGTCTGLRRKAKPQRNRGRTTRRAWRSAFPPLLRRVRL